VLLWRSNAQQGGKSSRPMVKLRAMESIVSQLRISTMPSMEPQCARPSFMLPPRTRTSPYLLS